MSYLLLAASVVFGASATILAAIFNRKNAKVTGASPLYNMLVLLTAVFGWGLLYLFDFSFRPEVLLYSVAFGVFYAAAQIGMLYALLNGPVSLTALLFQLSLVGIVIWGFIFWQSPITVSVIAGLFLMAVAMYLCIYQKEKKNRLSLKWFIFVTLGVAGNAGCSIIQRSQQLAFHGKYGNMLMFFAMIFSSVVCIILFAKSKKENTAQILKRSGFLPILAGGFNVLLNLIIILLVSTKLSPNLIYPTVGVGGLMLNTVVSVFCFKEKLTPKQYAGIAVGAVSILLLS